MTIVQKVIKLLEKGFTFDEIEDILKMDYSILTLIKNNCNDFKKFVFVRSGYNGN